MRWRRPQTGRARRKWKTCVLGYLDDCRQVLVVRTPRGPMVSFGMAFSTLITPAALALHLDDPGFAIVDCRFKLDDVAWGQQEYTTLHIPGAVYAHLDRDLSGPKTGTNGRHPLPDSKTLADTFSRLGIASGMQVVAYDQDNGMYASRLWWLLRWLGHDAAAVLDGGFKA